MVKLRVGIIGQGRSGYNIHASWLKQDKRKYQIVAVTDPIKKRRDLASHELGCVAYKDYKTLLKHDDIDLIVNTLPTHLHVSSTLEILKAGFNCVCEKPLTDKIKDVDRLITASKKAKRILAIFQQYRYIPSFLQLRKVIDSGVLGRIVQIEVACSSFSRRYDWQTLQEFMGGSLLNMGAHWLDQMLQILDIDTVPEVFCSMDRATTVGDAEDHVLIILREQAKPLIKLEISSCWPFPTPTYKVYGTLGGLKSTMTEMNWRYFDPSKNPKPRLLKKPLRNHDGTPSYPSDTIKWCNRSWKLRKPAPVWFNDMSKRFYDMLYKSITQAKPLDITLERIRQQVAIIEQCQKQNPLIYH